MMYKSNTSKPILTLMVALNCEVKPWVDFYKLKKIRNKPFELYQRDGLNIEVVITGIGAIAMSTAVGWAAGLNTDLERLWLNLGIAGHAERSVGELVRVHSFIDANDLKYYYPPLTAASKFDSDALLSVNAPTSSYPENALVDMEGLSFYRAASMFSNNELIASVKVVSDNQEHSVEELNASKITKLMLEHVEPVNKLAERLIVLANELNGSGNVDQRDEPISLDLPDIRRSHSQQQQLNRLLAKATVLKLHDTIYEDNFSDCRHIKAVIERIEQVLNETAPVLNNSAARSNASGASEAS